MLDARTYAADQRMRDARAALGDACETPAKPVHTPRGLRSAWSLIDGGDTQSAPLPPVVRIVREIAAAVIHHAIDEVWINRRAGALSGMRLTGQPPADPDCASLADLSLLIEFLCSPALDEWIEQYGLHITAAAVRRHLRITDPAADLAALAAYRALAHRIGPNRAAATQAAGLATPKAHRRLSAYAMVTSRPVRGPFAAPPRKRRGYIS
jgi:hypothetical protein